MISNGFKVTTEHIDNINVLCKVYNNKLIATFNVNDYGDWNEVECQIDDYVQMLKEVFKY